MTLYTIKWRAESCLCLFVCLFVLGFTVCIPVSSRVDKGNLKTVELRQSVPIRTLPFPTFWRILKALHFEWWNPTVRFAPLQERGNENIEILFSQLGINPQLIAFIVARLLPCATTCLCVLSKQRAEYFSFSKCKIEPTTIEFTVRAFLFQLYKYPKRL